MLHTLCFLALIAVVLIFVATRRHDPICDSVCGDVIIRYPFGIGAHCAGDDSFTVTCNASSGGRSQKPILAKLNLELIEVSLYDQGAGLQFSPGRVTVNMASVSVCADNNFTAKRDRWSSVNLSGSPFYLDTDSNVFASVGCDGNASLYNEAGEVLVSCNSTCKPSDQVIHWCRQNLTSTAYNSINYMGLVVDLNVGRSVSEQGGACTSAFLISKAFLAALDNPTIATAISYPVVLGWNPVDKVSVLATSLVSCGCMWSCWLYKTKERRKEARLRAKYFKGRLDEQRSSGGEAVKKTNLYTIKELKRATDNFNKDRVLGQGGQGTVYKGMLTNGQVLAIKRSRTFDESQWRQFINEVILLSQINHRNVVKLLGCCLETKLPVLVYEFIPNGTLSQHIHTRSSNGFLLVWEIRVRIACEIARAIAYLHSSSSVPIYHRDIKSTNVLLDDGYQAKISDFGISKAFSVDQTHLTTCVQGTFGYLDPEYFRSSQFSEKSDVYSFGVILVELLTGQQPIRATTSEEEKSLVFYFLSSMNESALDTILDPIVSKESLKEDVMVVANLAKRCLHSRGVKRPTMIEVFMELEKLRNKSSSTFSLLPQVSLEIENVVYAK